MESYQSESKKRKWFQKSKRLGKRGLGLEKPAAVLQYNVVCRLMIDGLVWRACARW